jgi:glyoxylase-like metal-dependent hydrolase (beta-lactamase superfamily II)
VLNVLTALALIVLPQIDDGPYDLAFVEVRAGIWMAYRPDPYRSPVFGNVTIVLTDQDVVVVDAGSSPRAARHVVAKIRELTDLPVTTLVNTHGHEDHVLGNQAFLEAWPDVQIVARPGTRDYLESGRVQARVLAFNRNMTET